MLVLLTMASLGEPIKVLVSYFLRTLQLLLLPFPPLLPQQPCYYHWRELPQVTFLSRQKVCCNKHTFVATKLCLLRQISVMTKVLSPQTCVCRDKKFCRNTKIVARTIFLLRQDVFCHDKNDTCVSSCQ